MTRTSTWLWVERALFVVGILCLGYWTWAWLDTRFVEARETRRLEETLAARAATGGASETDSLSSFKTQKTDPDPKPLQEGELLGRIEIPRLDVSAVILEGVGKQTLRRAAGHVPDTALPSEPSGNVGLAAHRDSFFRGLRDVREGDTIELTMLDGTYNYKVEWTKIVDPSEVSVLAPTDEPALTLVTCYPFHYVGSAPQRFIVRARR